MKINDIQRKKIHALLGDLSAYITKDAVLLHCTDQRTDSIKALTYTEANLVIRKLLEIQEDARKKYAW